MIKTSQLVSSLLFGLVSTKMGQATGHIVGRKDLIRSLPNPPVCVCVCKPDCSFSNAAVTETSRSHFG